MILYATIEHATAYFDLVPEEWEAIPKSAQMKLRAYVFSAPRPPIVAKPLLRTEG